MDTATQISASPYAAPPKVPRKPRPSELAAKAKKAKPKAKKKPAKKAAKAKRPKAKLAKRKPGKAKPKVSAGVVRTERLDLRLLPKEKAKLLAKAKTTRRTVTSVVQEMIEKLK